MLDAVRAVEAAGFDRREDFYFTLQAIFVSRPEERAVFAQVFRLFWRDPRYLEHMMSLMLPQVHGVQEDRAAEAAEKRAAEALLDGQLPPPPQDARPRRPDRDRRHRHHVGRGTAEDARFRTDVGRRNRRGQADAGAAFAARAAAENPPRRRLDAHGQRSTPAAPCAMRCGRAANSRRWPTRPP